MACGGRLLRPGPHRPTRSTDALLAPTEHLWCRCVWPHPESPAARVTGRGARGSAQGGQGTTIRFAPDLPDHIVFGDRTSARSRADRRRHRTVRRRCPTAGVGRSRPTRSRFTSTPGTRPPGPGHSRCVGHHLGHRIQAGPWMGPLPSSMTGACHARGRSGSSSGRVVPGHPVDAPAQVRDHPGRQPRMDGRRR